VIQSNSSDLSGGCGFFRFEVVIWLQLVENKEQIVSGGSLDET